MLGSTRRVEVMYDDAFLTRQCERFDLPEQEQQFSIAIPAHNESERIAKCLRALARQTVRNFSVVVFCNNCTDDTYARVRRVFLQEGLKGQIVDAILSSHAAHAGGARRAAMNLAADLLTGPSSVILTTDADSEPAPDWIAANAAAIVNGADCVAGCITLDPDDVLPPTLHDRGSLEAQYETLLTELFCRIDPDQTDPWPRHAQEPGASLALTVEAYREIGGLPALPVGEDKALLRALRDEGFRVRHDPNVRVSTSGRLVGRAAGGVADTLRTRIQIPDSNCDPYLERAWTAYRRAIRSKRCREFYQSADRAGRKTFAKAWQHIETSEHSLARTPLVPSDLQGQIKIAQAMVRRARHSLPKIDAAHRSDRNAPDADMRAEEMQPTL